MAEPVLKLSAEARLEVRQQVELPAGVAAVVLVAERHDAVRFRRSRGANAAHLSRIDRPLAADKVTRDRHSRGRRPQALGISPLAEESRLPAPAPGYGPRAFAPRPVSDAVRRWPALPSA